MGRGRLSGPEAADSVRCRMGASSTRHDARLDALLAFAAAMTRRDAGRACAALRAARRAGVPRREAEEAALLLVLHAGYPAALEGARVLAASWPGRARRSREGGPAAWRRRGAALCRRVYGPVYARLIESVSALHPDLAVWMVEHGYGRVLSRRPLGARARELLAVVVLAAGGWERQLVSHLLGARRLGNPPARIRAALRIALRGAPADLRGSAARAWQTAFGAGSVGPLSRPVRAGGRRARRSG